MRGFTGGNSSSTACIQHFARCEYDLAAEISPATSEICDRNGHQVVSSARNATFNPSTRTFSARNTSCG
jgi:hypothetical protein